MQSFLKVALVRYMSTWCSLVNNLFSCCLINTILLCLTTYTLLFDSDLLFFKVQIHEPNPKYKNIWIGYIPKYQNSQFKPKHVFEHLPLHRKSIDSRFMQLEMSVSSASLEEILPIKIPLHERYSSVSFKSEKALWFSILFVTLCNGSFRTGRYNKTHFDEDGGFEGFNVTIYSDYFHV